MFGGSLVIVEALAHMTPNDTKPMTAIVKDYQMPAREQELAD
jgi:hypothetical protein